MTDLHPDQTPDPADHIGLNVKSQALRQRRRQHRTPWSRFKRRLRRTHWAGVGLVALAVLAVAVVGALVLVTSAQNSVTDAWQSLDRVLRTLTRTPSTAWTLNDFDRLQASTDELARALAGAQRQTGFLRPLAAPLAGAIPEGETTFAVLDVAEAVVRAARNIFNGMEPTFFFLAGGQAEETVSVQVASGERVVELLTLGRGQFVDAQRGLDAAAAGLARLSGAEIPVSWLNTIEQLGRFHVQLSEINTILINGPELLTRALGLGGARNYLVLSQNSDELRPAGGYISTYGWLEVRNARIVDYNYSATTSRTPIPPQEGELDVPGWWIQYANPIYAAWDGSWSPDFPTTAGMAAWYYDAGGNAHSPVDGVIAIDMIGFEYILGGLGSVVVPGYEEIVTPENFRQVVYAIRAEETDNAHKEYLAAVYNAILDDWQNVDRTRGADIFGATLRALQEKHIMLYFREDAALNEAVTTLGWGGAQAPALTHDYILAADANLGSKSNRSILRQLIYDVAIQRSGRLQSRLTVAYDFPAAVAALDPAFAPEHYNNIDYDNLLQVFVPAGSTLEETNNLAFEPEVVTSDTHTEFVTQTLVEYNSGERFQFTYTTPPLVEPFGPYYRYRLLLQKQPGMLGEAASVQVRLPNGTRMVSTSPAVEASYDLEEQVLEFRVELVSDQWIEVVYRDLDR